MLENIWSRDQCNISYKDGKILITSDASNNIYDYKVSYMYFSYCDTIKIIINMAYF